MLMCKKIERGKVQKTRKSIKNREKENDRFFLSDLEWRIIFIKFFGDEFTVEIRLLRRSPAAINGRQLANIFEVLLSIPAVDGTLLSLVKPK